MKIKNLTFILAMVIIFPLALLQASISSASNTGVCYPADYQKAGTSDEIRISDSDLNDKFIPEDTGVFPSTPPDKNLSEKLTEEILKLEKISRSTTITSSLSPKMKSAFDKKMREYFPNGIENASDTELEVGKSKFFSDITDARGVLNTTKISNFLELEEVEPEVAFVAQFIFSILGAIENKAPEMLLQAAGPFGPFLYGWYEAGKHWSTMSDLQRGDALTGYLFHIFIADDLEQQRLAKELKHYLVVKKKLDLTLQETWQLVTDDIKHNDQLDDIEAKSLQFKNKILRDLYYIPDSIRLSNLLDSMMAARITSYHLFSKSMSRQVITLKNTSRVLDLHQRGIFSKKVYNLDCEDKLCINKIKESYNLRDTNGVLRLPTDDEVVQKIATVFDDNFRQNFVENVFQNYKKVDDFYTKEMKDPLRQIELLYKQPTDKLDPKIPNYIKEHFDEFLDPSLSIERTAFYSERGATQTAHDKNIGYVPYACSVGRIASVTHESERLCEIASYPDQWKQLQGNKWDPDNVCIKQYYYTKVHGVNKKIQNYPRTTTWGRSCIGNNYIYFDPPEAIKNTNDSRIQNIYGHHQELKGAYTEGKIDFKRQMTDYMKEVLKENRISRAESTSLPVYDSVMKKGDLIYFFKNEKVTVLDKQNNISVMNVVDAFPKLKSNFNNMINAAVSNQFASWKYSIFNPDLDASSGTPKKFSITTAFYHPGTGVYLFTETGNRWEIDLGGGFPLFQRKKYHVVLIPDSGDFVQGGMINERFDFIVNMADGKILLKTSRDSFAGEKVKLVDNLQIYHDNVVKHSSWDNVPQMSFTEHMNKSPKKYLAINNKFAIQDAFYDDTNSILYIFDKVNAHYTKIISSIPSEDNFLVFNEYDDWEHDSSTTENASRITTDLLKLPYPENIKNTLEARILAEYRKDALDLSASEGRDIDIFQSIDFKFQPEITREYIVSTTVDSTAGSTTISGTKSILALMLDKDNLKEKYDKVVVGASSIIAMSRSLLLPKSANESSILATAKSYFPEFERILKNYSIVSNQYASLDQYINSKPKWKWSGGLNGNFEVLKSGNFTDLLKNYAPLNTRICRAELNKGFHIGTFKNSICKLSWGGKVYNYGSGDKYQILTGDEDTNIMWKRVTNNKKISINGWEAVIGGFNWDYVANTHTGDEPLNSLTGSEGREALTICMTLGEDGDIYFGKIHINFCHFPYQGKETLASNYWVLLKKIAKPNWKLSGGQNGNFEALVNKSFSNFLVNYAPNNIRICRAKLNRGFHIGTFSNGVCKLSWGGRVYNYGFGDEYQILSGAEDANVIWHRITNRTMNIPNDWQAVIGGFNWDFSNSLSAEEPLDSLTGSEGREDLKICTVISNDGIQYFGKIHINFCHFPYQGREVLVSNYWILLMKKT